MAQPYNPFRETLRDLLIERGFTTSIGNPDWMTFSKTVSGYSNPYESIRKFAAGEREPVSEAGARMMEAVADALGVEPTVFVEYELWQARRQFDPREVGAEEALRNLERWAAIQRRRA